MSSFAAISFRTVGCLCVLTSLASADSPAPLTPGTASPAISLAATINSSPNTSAPSGTADVHLSENESSHRPSWAKFASGTGTALFVGAGTLLPLIEDGGNHTQNTLRVADSLLTSALVTEALKRVTHEQRPDGSGDKSFPSGHATAAFAVASMQAHLHPNQAIFWYLGASAIAASRVTLRRHYVHDVLAGAAIGVATTEIEIRQRHGLLLFPFIHGGNNAGQRVTGLSFGGTF